MILAQDVLDENAALTLLPTESVTWAQKPDLQKFKRQAFLRFLVANGPVAIIWISATTILPYRLVSGGILVVAFFLLFVDWYRHETKVGYVLTDQRVLKVNRYNGKILKAFGFEEVRAIRKTNDGLILIGKGGRNRIEIWDVEDASPVSNAITEWKDALHKLLGD